METIAHKQTTTHSSSHSEDEVSEGGRSGYPSDCQTALKKLNVSLSDDCDRAEVEFESKTPGPVSDRTRSKTEKKKKKVDASRYDNRSGATRDAATAAGSPGADETVRLNVGLRM